jgi:NAD dependent epimerase/dehydratase family enzyme
MAKLVIEGQYARPRRTLDLGYEFRHTDLDEALRAALQA